MTSRKPTRGGLVKDLPQAFLGARLPPGLVPEGRAILASHGHIVEVVDAEAAPTASEVNEADHAGAEPPTAEVIELDPGGRAATSPAPARAPKKARTSASTPKRKPRPKQSATASGDPRGGGRPQDYRLPPVGGSRKKTRSHHFRLPEDVEARLQELASAHGCSQTLVVCSAIVAESERFRRRRGRGKVEGEAEGDGGVGPT